MDEREIASVMTQRLQMLLGQQAMDLISAQARLEALTRESAVLKDQAAARRSQEDDSGHDPGV